MVKAALDHITTSDVPAGGGGKIIGGAFIAGIVLRRTSREFTRITWKR